MKKAMIMLLASMLLMGTFSGCNSKSEEKNTGGGTNNKVESTESSEVGEDVVSPAGEFPIVKEPITLKFFVEMNTTEETKDDIQNNKVLAMIKEKTNINLEIMPINYSAEGKQKLILSFAIQMERCLAGIQCFLIMT